MALDSNTKLAAVREAMARDDWERAIKLAAKLRSLGKYQKEIDRANDYLNHPKIYAQMGYERAEIVEAAIAALRLAGAPPLEASRVAEMLFERSLRAHKHGGRKSWTGPLALGDQEEVFKEVEALSARDPLLGRYYEVNCALALQFFGRHPKLLKALRERSSGQV